MARQDPQVRWLVRPVVVLLTLLVSLDLLLVGLVLLGRPAHPELTRRFAADQQAAVLDAETDRVRAGYGRFRERFDARADAARPEHVRKRVNLRKNVERVGE